MIDAICGGIVIGLGCIANYTVDGPLGALMFAMTILSAVYFNLDLFIGKPGILTNKNFDFIEMGLTFAGNFVGITWVALSVKLIPQYGEPIGKMAHNILARADNMAWDTAFVISIFAGLTLYGGIVAYQISENIFTLLVPVMMCILADWPISLVTIFLIWSADFYNWHIIIPIFLGNIIGVNLWHLIRRHSHQYQNRFKPDASDIASRFHNFVESTKNHDNNDNSFHK